MDSMQPCERIILPLDVSDINLAADLVNQLSPYVGIFKVGLEMIYSTMADLILFDFLKTRSHLLNVRQLANTIGDKTFLDVKLSDIPNTVDRASKAIVRLKPKMFNVHASSGKRSIEAAVANRGKSLVLGVTLLTSIDEEECISMFGDKPDSLVLMFSRMLLETGVNGIICSPKELEFLGKHKELDCLLKITPGVRPEWAATGDQKRIMTPAEAIKAGASYLVIGRPITNPPPEIGGPVEAAKRIAKEIASAVSCKS